MSRRTAPVKETYAERVGQIGQLMDTLAEARLERVTRTARRLFGVENAVVVLWRGKRMAYQAWGTAPARPDDLPLAMMAEVAESGTPRVLPDGAGPWEFVAIAPLYLGRGLSGCLCLVDEAARGFAADDLQALCDLATWAEHEVDVVHLGQALALRMA